MKTPNLITAVAVLIAACFLAATVQAQYYTPLRYDLRMSNPSYIPGGTLQFGPADQPNPYAFGQPQYGNLGLTRNLRFGQSFQGNVPYNQQGEQLSVQLPSLKLSNFNRDSYGGTDIGTGVNSYGGRPEPYFPYSGSVTNVQSAMADFAPQPSGARAPYSARGLSSPLVVAPTPTAGSFFTPSATATGAALGAPPPAEAMGIAIPQETVDWIDKIVAGRVSSTRLEAEAKGKEKTGLLGVGAGAAEPKKPVMTPYASFESEQGLMPKPDNIQNPNKLRPPTAEEKAAAEAGQVQLIPPWLRRPPSAAEPEAAPTSPKTVRTPSTSPAPGELELEPGQLPLGAPAPAIAGRGGTYATYVERAHAAMRTGAYEKAEAFYNAAEVMQAGQPEAFFGRVSALLAVKRLLQSYSTLQRGFVAHPDWVGLTPDIRLFYTTPDVYSRLIANLTEELAQKPGDLENNFLMGYVLFSAGQKQAAVPFLEKAAKARGDSTGAETLLLKAIQGR
jgi:hypothetical protein